MAVRDIITLPDPRLKLVSEPVARVDDAVRALMDDMLDTMYEAPGIGLAAIQIGVPKRVVVVDLGKDETAREPLCLANPEVAWTSEEKRVHEEG